MIEKSAHGEISNKYYPVSSESIKNPSGFSIENYFF